MTRSASSIREDIAAHASSDRTAFADALDALTEAEWQASWDAADLRFASRWPLVAVVVEGVTERVRREGEALAVPPALLDVPGLPEPACLVLAALLERAAPVTWGEVAGRFGVLPELSESPLHAPVLLAARDELLRQRFIRRVVQRVTSESVTGLTTTRSIPLYEAST